MSLWRLEWLRLVRTPRALALGAVFIVLGLLEPVATRYQSQIFASASRWRTSWARWCASSGSAPSTPGTSTAEARR